MKLVILIVLIKNYFNWLINDDKTSFFIKNDVYQGHHGDANYKVSDLVLPVPAFSEKKSTYISYSGKFQTTNFVELPNLNIRDESKFFITLGKLFSKDKDVFNDSYKDISIFNNINFYCYERLLYIKIFYVPINNFMEDYYRNDSISRNSAMMALVSNRINLFKNNFKQK
jgi:NADH dehydrogenase/NADH:ubiquinone oxidoreductase subunit G